MNTETTDQLKEQLRTKKFRGMKLPGAEFIDLDLTNADFRGCGLSRAKFIGCNLTYANFEGANLYGADFTKAILHRTNFKDANLSETIMDCADMFGITITLECKSFKGMKPAPGWWAGFLFYGLVMDPPTQEMRDKLIQAIGIEYWEVLRKQYASRQW